MIEEQPDSTARAVQEELASRESEMRVPVRPSVWWSLGVLAGLVLLTAVLYVL
jgi:hypothetical protein